MSKRTLINVDRTGARLLLTGFAWLTLVLLSTAHAETYYINSATGDDANPGVTVTAPWKSLARIEQARFQPGDDILLSRGGVWKGHLNLRGDSAAQMSGVAGQAILLGAYGTPDLPAPLLDGDGFEGAVLSLRNLSYWEVRDLEITNDAPDEADRRGVEVLAENHGLVSHITLENLHIHHIKGIKGQSMEAKATAGIYIAVTDDSQKPTRFDNVWVIGNHIHHVTNTGIATRNEQSGGMRPEGPVWQARRMTNILVENNAIHHITKNAMILRLFDGGLVQHNVIHDTALGITGNSMYTIASRGIIFQYNEGFRNSSPKIQDGAMYDADLNSTDIIFQYSYSHDNNSGLYWACTVPEDDGIIVRYNISQNDRNAIFTFSYGFSGTEIYNNTIFIGAAVNPIILYERRTRKEPQIYSFRNNLIYNLSHGARYEFSDSPDVRRTIEHNLFYGIHPDSEPDDVFKITADPRLANPVYSGAGPGSVVGFKLKAGSPAINRGKVIGANGGQDYFGNPLTDGRPDIGFQEYQD